jgi:NADPH:quinone reductase-like Zn-dependent oxidoreductase
VRAWRLHDVGSPAGLQLDDVPVPVLEPGDALVRIDAIGINSSELQIVTGYWEGRGIHSARTLPFTIGLEGAGEVVAVAPGVRAVAVGDRVAIHYIWSCGTCDDCVRGSENTCRRPAHFGRSVPGAYAELARVPAEFLVPLPLAVGARDAAATFIAAATAWHMLIRVGALAAGETVLVTGGSSGIGSAAIQLARLAGARVIATTGGPVKTARLRDLGAEHAIDHRAQPDFGDAIRALTAGRGVDLAYDAVGGTTFAAALASLRTRGRLVAGGYMGGAEVPLSIVGLTGSEARILGSSSWTRAEARRALDLVASGRIVPVIDSVFPFEALPQALERLASREAFGKIVVDRDATEVRSP